MGRGRSSKNRKCKRRASRTPSPSPSVLPSDEVMGVTAPQATQATRSRKNQKVRRLSSPERVMSSALSKLEAKNVPKKGTGLAALATFITTRGSAESSAANLEAHNGLKGGAKRPKAKNGTRSAITVRAEFFFFVFIMLSIFAAV
jgi:hypothetical protein